jgi:pimeloyl-ACP methyl ester carboxylesterase
MSIGYAETAPSRAEVVEFPDLGHMAPVTHPERVNGAIRVFLDRN